MNDELRGSSELASLATATAWINSPPLTEAGLKGKVVLVDFWTYTCINWLRTLPYTRAWAEKYKAQGLVVIGVHTPEFSVEKQLENVRWSANYLRVPYPIAVDNDYKIWRAFSNNYWPAVYLIDARGRVRYQHFGEGAYDETETMIQLLLAEANGGPVGKGLVSVEGQGVEAAADWGNLRSPENYLGYQRTQNFSSPDGVTPNAPRTYTVPPKLRLNQWALAGDWTAGKEAVVLNKGGGRIVYRFHARDVNLVMGPMSPSKPVRFRVLIDGSPPGAGHGVDVDADGNGTAKEQRMYQLIRQPMPIVDRTLRDRVPGRGSGRIRVHVWLSRDPLVPLRSAVYALSVAHRRETPYASPVRPGGPSARRGVAGRGGAAPGSSKARSKDP